MLTALRVGYGMDEKFDEMVWLLRMRTEILRISNEPNASRRLASWLMQRRGYPLWKAPLDLGPQLRAAPPKRPFSFAAGSDDSALAERRAGERFALYHQHYGRRRSRSSIALSCNRPDPLAQANVRLLVRRIRRRKYTLVNRACFSNQTGPLKLRF
jgi:hypothetical protein